MFFTNKKYRFYNKERIKKIRIIRNTVLLVLFVLLVIGLVLSIIYKDTISKKLGLDAYKRSPEYLWEHKDYANLIKVCNVKLKTDPMNRDLLILRGFGSYYRAQQVKNSQTRLDLLTEAMYDLKKARVMHKPSDIGKIDYILGKICFMKDRFYCDEAIYYLNSALKQSYFQKDIYYYLGLSYSKLGKYNEAIESFSRSDQSEKVKLSVAITHFKNGETDKAFKIINEITAKTKSPEIKFTCYNWIGKIYTENGQFENAIDVYTKLIETYPESADAHYLLGMVYLKMNNIVKARSEGRKAIRLDPMHYGTTTKLLKEAGGL